MSIEALAIVLHHSKAKGAAKVTLIGIANHAGDGGAYPAVATLAKYGNVKPNAVQKHLSLLIEMGELRRDIGAGKKTANGSTNLYEILVTCPPECDGTMNHRNRTGIKSATPGVDNGIPLGVDDGIPKPSIEPSINHIVDQSATAQRFIEFWNIYPHRKGDARKPAEKSFSRLSVTNQELAIEGARKLAENPAEPQFRPMAATWLNQERWTSELETETAEPQEKDWEWGY